MTADYSPSPELVEAPLRVLLRHDGYPEDHYPLAPQIAEDNRALTAAMLTAAVAFRHPDGHPELVPWEQVRELVDAFKRYGWHVGDCDARWGGAVIPDDPDDGFEDDPNRPCTCGFRAALAPFTQEPQP